MNSKRVTNLFIPISSKRFWMKKLESFEPCMIEQIFSDEEDLLEFSLPAGLADAAKLNGDYKEIVSMFWVASYDNDKALLMTNKILTTPAGSMLSKSKLWRGLGRAVLGCWYVQR